MFRECVQNVFAASLTGERFLALKCNQQFTYVPSKLSIREHVHSYAYTFIHVLCMFRNFPYNLHMRGKTLKSMYATGTF